MEQQLFEIVRRAHEELACPICSRGFEMGEIRVRGIMNKHYLVQASCHQGHPPSLVLCIVSEAVRPDNALTTDDVLDLHQSLKSFNGDFKAAFAKLQ